MSAIIVCSLADIATVAAREKPAAMATLINAHTPVSRPAEIHEDRHLLLHFNDIPAEVPGLTAPARGHVERFLAFVDEWSTGADSHAPLLVHCYAGISRSTAGAYIATLAMEPERDEMDLAQHLRMLSPSATPNPRLIAFADDILGRKGRMIRAIESIGRGADAFQGDPFKITLSRR
jgi:predicted protein tyrosine phosphatase